jgi:hypothetical protein
MAPAARRATVDGSGVSTTTMPNGLSIPETNAGFTVVPDVVYSPIVPLPKLVPQVATNRFDPSTVIPNGSCNPETSEAFIVDPSVPYSPIVFGPWLVTNRSDPERTRPVGSLNPETSEGFTVDPSVPYSPIVSLPIFVTNRFDPDTASPNALLNPDGTSEAFTMPPEFDKLIGGVCHNPLPQGIADATALQDQIDLFFGPKKVSGTVLLKGATGLARPVIVCDCV